MTLRRRLVIAVSALAVVLVVAGLGVLLLQRAFLVERLDAQLAALAQNPRAILVASARAEAGAPAAGLSDVYVGRMAADGTLTTVLSPASDPDLVPALAPGETVTDPQARATASGEAARVRVVTAPLPNGRAQAVLAVPTTAADAATRRLALTLGLVGLAVAGVLGLLLRWVDHLGLRPIAAMTEAADAIRGGDVMRRVPPGAPGTEAARLGDALNAMIDTNAATQERMRRFVADASHELRTPLTTLQGYAALHTGRSGTVPGAVEPPSDAVGPAPEVTDAMRRIGEEAARMRRLVDGLLDLARLDDLGVLVREPVDLGILVRDVAADLRVVAPDRVVTVEAPESLVVVGGPRPAHPGPRRPHVERRAAHASGHAGLAAGRVGAGSGARRRRRRGGRHPPRAPAARVRALPPGRARAVDCQRRHRARAGHRRRDRAGPRRVGCGDVRGRPRVDLHADAARLSPRGRAACG